MQNIINFFKRNVIWFGLGLAALLLLSPAAPEFRTLLLAIAIECLALAMSGLSVYVYTKMDFIQEKSTHILGQIFLGVHICSGLCVLGVYMAQWGM